MVGVAAASIGAAVLAGPATAGAVSDNQPTVAFTPSTYSFGSVTVGQEASQVFTLTNSGESATSVLKLALTGSSALTTTNDTCSTASLGPGKSCTVTVQFAPTTAGSDTVSLTATSNKPAAIATLSISGAGTATPVCPSHTNGLGQSYVDCNDPTGTPGDASTYNQNMAIGAAHAWAPSGNISLVECLGPSGTINAVENQTAVSAATWSYSGTTAGHVFLNTQGTTGVCPSTADPAWN